jgi:4-carboxymuconolactone decarboxylase
MRPLLVVLLLANVTPATAQDRMPPIPSDKMTDAQRAAAGEFARARGTDVFGPFTALLRSPEVMTSARMMGDYLRYRSVLPPRLSELVILIIAREWSQQYEWHTHRDIAVKAGVKPETAAAIAVGRRPAGMADDEELVYDFCVELLRTRSVSDSMYQRIAAKFGEQGVIDTAGIMGYYTFLAMTMNVVRTPLPPGVDPPLPALPR